MILVKMFQRWGCVILAVGAVYISSAFGQVMTGMSIGKTRLDAEPSPAAAKQSRAQQPPSANPLWGVPIDKLTATRERPIFSASRRPPAPPAPAELAAPPPPPPAEPERPQLILVGTVTGEPQNVAIVKDQKAKPLCVMPINFEPVLIVPSHVRRSLAGLMRPS